MAEDALQTSMNTHSTDSLREAARHISRQIQQEARLPEPWDLLHASSSRDYSYERGGLHFARLSLLPEALLSQFERVECKCFMGLFTEIGRAWMTVDRRLFLWDYETGHDFCCFDELDQIIIDVNLVRPRAGVFVKQIEWLLVIATPLEISLIGVSFGAGSTNITTDAIADRKNIRDMILHPTQLVFPADDVNMLAIVGTPEGRIFLGGHDGQLYELEYRSEEGWFTRKCRKLNRTGSAFSAAVLPFLRALASSGSSPRFALTYDASHGTLYSLSEDGSIGLFYLGPNRKEFKHVSNVADLYAQATRLCPAAAIGRAGFRLVAIHAVPSHESVHIHLVAVTASGVRLYFSTFKREQNIHLHLHDHTHIEPSCLELVHVRLPPDDPRRSTLLPGTAANVHTAYYKDGLFLAASAASEYEDLIVGSAFNSAASLSASIVHGNPALIHGAAPFETILEATIEGKVWDIEEAPNDLVLASGGLSSTVLADLCRSQLLPPRRLLLLTNAGVYIFSRTRPLDHLAQLLAGCEGQDSEAWKQFFEKWTPEQACAMCITLACSASAFTAGKTPSKAYGHAHGNVAAAAVEALFKYGGEPRLVDAAAVNTDAFRTCDTLKSEIRYSGIHDGVYLYFSRIVGAVWKTPVWNFSQPTPELLVQLQQLADFFIKTPMLFDSNSRHSSLASKHTPLGMPKDDQMRQKHLIEVARQAEANSLMALKNLVSLAIELFSFLSIAIDYSIISTMKEQPHVSEYDIMDFETLLCSSLGREFVHSAASLLVQRQLRIQASVEPLCELLKRRAPSFFNDAQLILYSGTEALDKAKRCRNATDQEACLNESLTHFSKVVDAISLNTFQEIALQYQKLAFHVGVIDLGLAVAKAVDSHDIALALYQDPTVQPDSQQMDQVLAREHVYSIIFGTLGDIHSLNTRNLQETVKLEPSDIDHIRVKCFQHATLASDELFHVKFYDWLVQEGMTTTLLDLNTEFIEDYLRTAFKVRSMVHRDLLWKWLAKSQRYFEAAMVLLELAEASDFELRLKERIECLSLAVTQAKSASSLQSEVEASLRDLEERLDVAYVQFELLEQLSVSQGGETPETLALETNLFPISELFNRFARPMQLPEICLRILDCAGYRDPKLMATFWQAIIDKALGDEGATLNINRSLERLSAKIGQLGHKLYPSDYAFPLAYLVGLFAQLAFQKHADPGWLPRAFEATENISNPVFYEELHRLSESRIAPWNAPAGSIYLYEMIKEFLSKWIKTTAPGEKVGGKLPAKLVDDRISSYLIALTPINVPQLGSDFTLLQRQLRQRF